MTCTIICCFRLIASCRRGESACEGSTQSAKLERRSFSQLPASFALKVLSSSSSPLRRMRKGKRLVDNSADFIGSRFFPSSTLPPSRTLNVPISRGLRPTSIWSATYATSTNWFHANAGEFPPFHLASLPSFAFLTSASMMYRHRGLDLHLNHNIR